MSKKVFHVDVLTPGRKVLEIEATQVRVETPTGSMGFLPRHLPLVSPLAPVHPVHLWLENGKQMEIAACGGFVEVRPNRISILAEVAELPDEIDVNRATEAKARAEERLKDKKDVDFLRAEASLKRAMMRLNVANTYGSGLRPD